MTYLGDLKPFFSAVALRCLAGALVLLSVEKGTGHYWQLRSSGRYAHSHLYVSEMAADGGFSLCCHEAGRLRRERGEWIEGIYYLFRSRK
ncbi:MAG: hypothetical protein CSA31_00890 [Desulfobulbus propionicus]|nr:MAG: hypothetical protein CSA31_00890 [Desulfobulbus propionicus]